MDELEALYRSRFDVFARVAASVTGDSERRATRCRSVRNSGTETSLVPERRSARSVGLAHRHERCALGRSSEHPPFDHGEPFQTNGHPEDEAELRAALARLPERQRTAVFLRYYADLDYASIGEALGIRPGTVAATLNAAHAALRSRLEEART